MKKESSKNKKILSRDNFTPFNKGDDLIPEINLKLVNNLVKDELVSVQEISAQDSATEDDLIERFNKIISIKYDLLTPFTGYTLEKPHLLVSDFDEEAIPSIKNLRESDKEIKDIIFLDKVFHQNKSSPVEWLDDTCKTKIALCVAKSMMILHENDIVHGNLQPKTIKIIGDAHIPHLVDYGLNEFRGSPRNVHPNQYRYLAPELDDSNSYSKETDVFAFGLFLCELLAGRNYKRSSEPPPNIKSAPDSIRELIENCLNRKPKKRPKFSEIYSQFLERTYYFEETDKELLKNDIKILKEIDEKRINTEFRDLVNLDKDNLDVLIRDAKKVNQYNAINFFDIIGNHFEKKTDPTVFKALLNVSLRLVQLSVFCKSFVNAKLHLNLPFDQEPLYPLILDIVYHIVQSQPNAIADIADSLTYIMPNPHYTKKVLVIFNEYQKKFSTIQNPWTFIDKILVTFSKNKNMKYQSNFISVFFSLCKTYPIYKRSRLVYCVEIFSSFVDSPNHSTVRAVYAFLSEYKNEDIPSNINAYFYSCTAKNLVNPHTALAAVKYLLVKESFDIKMDLVIAAMRLATISKYGNFLLCKIADDERGASLLMKKMDFIELPLPDLEGTLRVLLILLRRNKYNIKAYMNSQSLPFFISKLSVNADIRMIRLVINLLFIIRCDSKFISELDENGFFAEFYISVLTNGDEQTLIALLNIFQDFAYKNPKLEFFKDLITSLKDLIKRINQGRNSSIDILKEILSLLTVLSSIKSLYPSLKGINIESDFSRLLNLKRNEPEIKKLSDIFQKNMSAYSRQERSKSVS